MRLPFVMLAASTLTACAPLPLAPTTPYWDTHFGANARLALAQRRHPVDGDAAVFQVARLER